MVGGGSGGAEAAVVLAHAFNSTTQEAEAEGLAWFISQVLG